MLISTLKTPNVRGIGWLTNEIMLSNKFDTLRNVKVVSSIEFQGEFESAIIFWFQEILGVLFWESDFFILVFPK